MPPSSSSLPLIKGYLPVRVYLPGSNGQPDETFFFCKEHFASAIDNKKQGSTLFVANAPIVPGVETRLVLQSLLGRFGDIERVTVVKNPRLQKETAGPNLSWTTIDSKPSFFGPVHSEGRFAHVVFTSPKEMKRAWRAVCDTMTGKSKQSKDLPGLMLEKLEIQTLRDATERIARQEAGNDSDKDESDASTKARLKGILAVAEHYRKNCQAMSRQAVMEECNRVIRAYEDAEEEDRRKRETEKNQPDEDGFVTVTYAAQSVGSKRELNEGSSGQHRRQGSKRSRKKKENGGSTGLTDFYRFQTKDTRKRSLQDLRKKFEEDLVRVKKMKEERQYKPF